MSTEDIIKIVSKPLVDAGLYTNEDIEKGLEKL